MATSSLFLGHVYLEFVTKIIMEYSLNLIFSSLLLVSLEQGANFVWAA